MRSLLRHLTTWRRIYSGFQMDATCGFRVSLVFLCAFAPWREPTSRQGAKAQRKEGVVLNCKPLYVSLALFILPWLAWQRTSHPAAVAVTAFTSSSSLRAAEAATRAHVAASYLNLPLRFEANRGQANSQVKFLSRGSGYSLFLLATEAVLALRSADRRTVNDESEPRRSAFSLRPSSFSALRMRLVGAGPAPRIEGLGELPGKSNYFTGRHPEQWRTQVPAYARVKYQAVYPGVDVVYYGHQRQLEYDFIVAPGADPGAIRLAFTGANKITVDAEGNLVLRTGAGQVRIHRPKVYQEAGGKRREISGSYVRTGRHAFGFRVGDYDVTRPLVIDPILSWSTYLGGNGEDIGRGIAVDASGNAYVTGSTTSTDFPTRNPLQPVYRGGGDFLGDVFVTKVNAAGTALLYSTYLGGAGEDNGLSIAVDASGNAYVTGDTSSPDFPTRNPLQSSLNGREDAFIAKLNPDGSALVYSTWLGGRFNESGYKIVVDASGGAYVAGYTTSPDFPTVNPVQSTFSGFQNGFVARLNPAGTALVYSTFLGGGGDESAVAHGIALDAAGNMYVTGLTNSTSFPTRNPVQATYGGNQDAYVTKLNPSGSAIIYSTYLGGNGEDIGRGIAVDAAGNAYVTGLAASPDFPLVNPLQRTPGGGFAAKLNPVGSLIYSTYINGIGRRVAVDAVGNAWVTGLDYSGVNQDAFVRKLNAEGSALVYSTLWGGSRDESGLDIAVDGLGNAWVTGFTRSSDFPTVGALQSGFGGGNNDAWLLKLGADVVTASAASYSTAALTSKAIVAAFGQNLATTTQAASALPLPTSLAGTQVRVKDSAGTERLAPLFFVSPGQINYQIPAGTAAGAAAVTVINGDGGMSTGIIRIVATGPALFSLDQSGSGAAAAVDAFTGAGGPFAATRANGEPNIIAFFGTGLGEDATDVDGNVGGSMEARIGRDPATSPGDPMIVLYAGRAPGFVGLNQLNMVLPVGILPGTYLVVVRRNGVQSNPVTVMIR